MLTEQFKLEEALWEIGNYSGQEKAKEIARLMRAEGDSEEKIKRITGCSFRDLDG